MQAPHSETTPGTRRIRFRQGATEALAERCSDKVFGWPSRQARAAIIGNDFAYRSSDCPKQYRKAGLNFADRESRELRRVECGILAVKHVCCREDRLFNRVVGARTGKCEQSFRAGQNRMRASHSKSTPGARVLCNSEVLRIGHGFDANCSNRAPTGVRNRASDLRLATRSGATSK